MDCDYVSKKTFFSNTHTLTLKIESINETTNFGKPYMEEYWFFFPNGKSSHMHNQASYHPSQFQLEYNSNNREIAF